MSKFLMLHGYGHDMMGKNPNGKHGSTTMEMLDDMLLKKAKELNVEVESFKNNYKKVVSDRIFSASAEFDGILFNPASWMDNGQDLCEALDKCTIPVLEIHLGNFNKKDTVTNVIAPHVTGILSGFGEQVYPLGLEVLNTYLKNR